MFGVKFGDLAKLQKRIKVDHALAAELWKSGNHDARLLACMVADASAVTEKELKTWAGSVKDSSTADALAALVSRTSMAAKLREAWLADAKLRRAGWSLVGHCAKEGNAFDETTALGYAKRIEADIHSAENWTTRTMMYVLIGVGSVSAKTRKAAEEAMRRIGPVAFDPVVARLAAIVLLPNLLSHDFVKVERSLPHWGHPIFDPEPRCNRSVN